MKTIEERLNDCLVESEVGFISTKLKIFLMTLIEEYAIDYHARHINYENVENGKEFERLESDCLGITKFLEEEKYRVDYILDKSELNSNRMVELVRILNMWKDNHNKY